MMTQYMYENKIEMALVSEPNVIPGGNWLGDATGLATVYWRMDETCTLVRRGKGYVAVEIGKFILISAYCSPNMDKEELEKMLEEIESRTWIGKSKKVIIGGDLNARAKVWDIRCNAKGYILEKWVHKMDMMVMNDGRADTCVRAQGSSRVDVTVATAAAAKEISEWEVVW